MRHDLHTCLQSVGLPPSLQAQLNQRLWREGGSPTDCRHVWRSRRRKNLVRLFRISAGWYPKARVNYLLKFRDHSSPVAILGTTLLRSKNLGTTLLREYLALRQLKLYWQPLVFTTRRGVLVSCGFYDSKRSIGFVRFFVFTTRRGVLVSCGFFTTRRGVLVSYGFFSFSFFSSFWPWAFSLEALHWRAWYCFTHHSHIHSQIIHSHIHLQLKKRVTTNWRRERIML